MVLTEDLIPEMIEHQKRSFFSKEPLGDASDFANDEYALNLAIEYSKQSAKEGLSIVALNEDKKVKTILSIDNNSEIFAHFCLGGSRRHQRSSLSGSSGVGTSRVRKRTPKTVV